MRFRSSSFRVMGAAAFVSTLVVAPAVRAAADSLAATRGAIVEKSHTVDLTLSRGHARMRVVREVTNGGERHDQATFHLYLPNGAVATGLRTRGMQDGKPVREARPHPTTPASSRRSCATP